MGNLEDMTERQREDWHIAIAEINRYNVGASENPDHYDWHFDWSEESRPGRGQSFSALFINGEHFAQVMMDVYGYPVVSVCALDILHSGSDEECPCDFCKESRYAEYTPEERLIEEAVERKAAQRRLGRIPRHRELVTVPGPDDYRTDIERAELDRIEKILDTKPDYSRITAEHFIAADRSLRGGYRLPPDPAIHVFDKQNRPSLWRRVLAGLLGIRL
jgi:hypothetical protein